jgi:FlaA1/EpsC-like NDP-sugar epimerase
VRAFITGSRGSIGAALAQTFDSVRGWDVVDGDDVLDAVALAAAMRDLRPDVVFHLAGAKHAGSGETDPLETTRVNVLGTANVLQAAPAGARVVTASTCKAADPETVYGATKLIAERMTLAAGHTVARFYNVRESSGNVFEIWAALPDPVPVTRCWRYFISIRDAVRLLLAAAAFPPGRYTINPGDPRFMPDVASELGRAYRQVPPRRGDRLVEPRVAACETLEEVGDGIERIRNAHDQNVGDTGPDVLRQDAGLRSAA